MLESDGSGPPKPYIYQAIEFRKGNNLPAIEQVNMSKKQLHETWVLARGGICASHCYKEMEQAGDRISVPHRIQ